MTDLSQYSSGVATELYFKAEIPGHTLLFTDADYTRTIGSDVYSNVSSLIAIGNTESNISVSPTEFSITIDGIDSANFAAASSPNVKYSPVTLLRAWIDPNTDASIPAPPVGSDVSTEKRFVGFISSVVFNETWNAPDSGFTVTFRCVSSVSRLTDHVNGRRTNNADMKRVYPTDTSFKRVAKLTNANFNFGVPNTNPTAGTKS